MATSISAGSVYIGWLRCMRVSFRSDRFFLGLPVKSEIFFKVICGMVMLCRTIYHFEKSDPVVKVVVFSALDHSSISPCGCMTLSGNVDKPSSACGCVRCFFSGYSRFRPSRFRPTYRSIRLNTSETVWGT